MVSTSAPRLSRPSLSSIKQTASNLPKRKVCSRVAQWFTIPQLVLKILAVSLGVLTASLTLTWESNDVTAWDLDTDSFEFRGRVYAFIAVGLFSVAYAGALLVVGLAGVRIPAVVQTCLAGACLFLWFVSAPIMSATVTELGNSRFARWRDLDLLQLQIATALGLLSMAVSVGDLLLAFLQLSQADSDSSQFSVELEQSRSTIQAVKSGVSQTLSVTVRKRPSQATLREDSQSEENNGDGSGAETNL